MVKNKFCLGMVMLREATIFNINPDPKNIEVLAKGTEIKGLINIEQVFISGKQISCRQEAIQVLGNFFTHWLKQSQILITKVWPLKWFKLTLKSFSEQRMFSVNNL